MIAPDVFGRLNAAVINAVKTSGGKEGAAATVEKSPSLTGSWRNPNDTAVPRVDDAFALDQVAVVMGHRPPILSAYAAELGHVVIPVPEERPQGSDINAALIDASAEFGDIATEIREATRDHKVCARDRDRIAVQIDEAMASLARLRLVVNAIAKGE